MVVGDTTPTERSRPGRRLDAALALSCALVALLGYLRTMRPTFGWGDSSELTTAAYHLGIGHSPGYPTWILLMHPFSRLPIGTVAFRVNLATVIAGAIAVGLLYYVFSHLAKSRPAGVIAALAFAFSPTFWDQTTEAEVYTLHVAFAALIILLALMWRRTRHDRWLYLLSWVTGISLGNHALTALMIPALIYFVWAERGGRFFTVKRVALCCALLALGLSIYTYELIRGAANPPPHLNNPHSLAQFWQQLTAPGARESMFDRGLLVSLTRARNRLAEVAWILYPRPDNLIFGRAGVILGFIGLFALGWRDRRLTAFLLLLALFDVAYAMNFSIFDIYIYYLPLHLVWAAFIAVGAAWVIALAGRQLERITSSLVSPSPVWRYGPVVAILMALVPVQFFTHLRQADGSTDYTPEWFARATFRQVEPNALILADWWAIAPLGYLKHIEGQRDDVVMYAAPSLHSEGAFLDFSRRNFLEGFEAIYFVELLTYKAGLLREKYWLVPEGPVARLYLDRPDPATLLADLPAIPTVRFDDKVGLVKVKIANKTLRPGECVDFTVYWTPLPGYDHRRYQAIYTLTKGREQIWQESAVLGYDLYPAGQWQQGQALMEKHRIYLEAPEATGEYELRMRVRPRGESKRLVHDRAPVAGDNRELRLGSVTVGAPLPP